MCTGLGKTGGWAITMANINRTILVPATLAPLARALAAGLSAGGTGMFEVPLCKAGQITYYVSSGWIDEGFGMALTDADALFSACGGAATLAQCQALVAQSIVVDCDVESAQATMDKLGLTV